MRRIYVIDPSGTVISCYPPEKRAELVGGLVHALSLFSKEVLSMEISEVRMGHYYMLLGKTKQNLRVAVISLVREKRLLEKAINELDAAFKNIEIVPGLITDDIIRIATESLKRAFEEIPPIDIATRVINYALETPRKAPPSWINRCRNVIRRKTTVFEEKIRRALERKNINKRYLRKTIDKLLIRDIVGAWKAALKSGSKVAILHTSISLARVDPRVDGMFLRKYFNHIEDPIIRRYIELRHKSLIDLDFQYDKTFREAADIGKKLLERAETDDECLVLYLPLTTARPKRLEEMIPLEEKLLQDFYMRFVKLKREAETLKENYEVWRKFAELCNELYMDLTRNIPPKSPTYLLLISNTFESVSAMAEISENPQVIAREFLEKVAPFIDDIVRSIKHNAWRKISIYSIIKLLTSIFELTILSENDTIKNMIMNSLSRIRKIMLRTITYTMLRKTINILTLGYLILLTPLAPLLGDDELVSILFFSHPIISRDGLEKLLMNRPEYGLGVSTLIHLGSLMYRKYYLGRKIDRSALEIAELSIQEIERRMGEKATKIPKWLLERISDT